MPSDSQTPKTTQNPNHAHLLQMVNEAILTASTPQRAAVEVVRLYTLLSSVRKRDAVFQKEWGRVLDGDLPVIVGYPRGLARLTWVQVDPAYEVLLRLMERHGLMQWPGQGVGLHG